MIVYDNHDLTSFEIESALLGRNGVVRVVRHIPGAVVLRTPKMLSRFRESEFCEFQVNGEHFAVEENEIGGRYSVFPRNYSNKTTLDLVRQVFCESRIYFGLLLNAGKT